MATSELSQAKLFPDGQADDRLTSSLEVSRANPYLSPGSAWARRMTAISGQRCFGSLQESVPIECLVKTLLESSRWGSTLCYLTWNRSVTPAGRLLFRLRPSAPPTAGIASGFSQSMWPTPTAVDRPNEGNVRILRGMVLDGSMSEQEATAILGKSPFEPQGKIPGFWPTPNVAGGGNQCELTPHKGHFLRPSGEKAHLGLDQAVRMWPTPRASENENRQTKPTPSQLAGTHGKSLAAEVMVAEGFFPTPSASDNRDRGHANMPAIKRRIEMGKQVMLSMQVQQAKGQKLSAAWVSRLMGYPDGWMNDLPVDPLANVASTLNAYQRARQKTMDMLVMDPDHPPMDGKSEQAS
jgi:hypothetical protein